MRLFGLSDWILPASRAVDGGDVPVLVGQPANRRVLVFGGLIGLLYTAGRAHSSWPPSGTRWAGHGGRDAAHDGDDQQVAG